MRVLTQCAKFTRLSVYGGYETLRHGAPLCFYVYGNMMRTARNVFALTQPGAAIKSLNLFYYTWKGLGRAVSDAPLTAGAFFHRRLVRRVPRERRKTTDIPVINHQSARLFCKGAFITVEGYVSLCLKNDQWAVQGPAWSAYRSRIAYALLPAKRLFRASATRLEVLITARKLIFSATPCLTPQH